MAAKRRGALALFFVVLMSLGACEAANEVLVGGKPDAWKVPTSPAESLETWSHRARFAVGDSLVWKYDGTKDSVLQVTKEAFLSCNTTDPIAEHKDGNTKVKLDRPGPFYFISGAPGHCAKGQKLMAVVVTPRKALLGGAPAPSPSESPAAPAPVTGSASTARAGLVAVGVLSFWVLSLM